MIAALWFYFNKNQTHYFIFNILLLSLALIWMIGFVPESPVWLYEKRMYDELHNTLKLVSKFNGISDPEETATMCIEKLKKTA